MTKEAKILTLLEGKYDQIDPESKQPGKDFFADIKFADVVDYVLKHDISPKGYYSQTGWSDGTYILGSGDAWISYSQERGSISSEPKLYNSKKEAEIRYLRDVCDAFLIQN